MTSSSRELPPVADMRTRSTTTLGSAHWNSVKLGSAPQSAGIFPTACGWRNASRLTGILRHKIVDRIRLAARDTAEALPHDDSDDSFGSLGGWLHAPQSWSGDPARLSENTEFWQQVRACFGALPDRQAQVFALRTFDGMETEEICSNRFTNVPRCMPASVENRLEASVRSGGDGGSGCPQ